MDTPVIIGSQLPLLAGPIQKEALQSLGSVALYTGLSDDPGRFQWKMSHVVELLTNQLTKNIDVKAVCSPNVFTLKLNVFVMFLICLTYDTLICDLLA